MTGPADPDPYELRPRLQARTEREDVFAPAPGSRAARREGLRTFHRPTPQPLVRTVGPASGSYQRRVMVHVHRPLKGPTQWRNLDVHLRYIDRTTGVSEKPRAALFDQQSDAADRRAFIRRCREDPAHLRLMVKPGVDSPLPDMRAFGRRLMSAFEAEQGFRLEWIAADHHDTGYPHLHIVVRTRSPDGPGLGGGRRDLTQRLRSAAREIATDILGPASEQVRPYDVRRDGFTRADGVILESLKRDRLEIADVPDYWRTTVLRRLAHLEDRGWVEDLGPSRWRVPSDLGTTLRRVGRESSLKLSAARILRNSAWRDQHQRLVAATLAPEERFIAGYVGVEAFMPGRSGVHCVVADGLDGRLAYLEMRTPTSVMCLDRVRPGAVIEILGQAREPRASDRRIAEVAAASHGSWSMEIHAGSETGTTPRYLRMFLARLEKLTQNGVCRHLGDGRFEIPPDFCDRALAADMAQWGPIEHQIRVLDDRPLDEQVRVPGLTWLDRLMTGEELPKFSGPFGADVAAALPEREKRLRMTGLGSGDPLVLSAQDVRKLQAMELRSVMEPLEKGGKAVFLLKDGQMAAGRYVERVHISGSPYAVLEGGSAFHLVPWTPGMEACRWRWIEAAVADGRSEFRSIRNAARQFGLG